MKYTLYTLLLLSLFSSCNSSKEVETTEVDEYAFIDSAFNRATVLYKQQLENNPDVTKIPRSIHNDGTIYLTDRKNWTSGFFPGSLWYLYEYTNDDFWKEKATAWTNNLDSVQYQTNTHDIGFIAYCSFGNGYRLTQDTHYLSVIHQTSKTLAKRFNPNVGCTKSWNRYKFSEKWQYPVIIDNMMNLEMLHFAAKKTGDATFKNIAVSHANTTMKNHFRKDYSSYHVVDYDSITGEVIQKNTHQGINDSSSWARGQTWGLYGFTFSYRETGDTNYLNQAKGIANYIMSNPLIPSDKIPLWDYCDPADDAPRDASAAALTASALLELSQFVDENTATNYIAYATDILRTLSSDAYLNKPGENHNFILLHCTGNYPNGTEIDKPISYGDYYFLEALHKLSKVVNKEE